MPSSVQTCPEELTWLNMESLPSTILWTSPKSSSLRSLCEWTAAKYLSSSYLKSFKWSSQCVFLWKLKRYLLHKDGCWKKHYICFCNSSLCKLTRLSLIFLVWPHQWMQWWPFVSSLPCPLSQPALSSISSRRGPLRPNTCSSSVVSVHWCTGWPTSSGTWYRKPTTF